MRSFLYVVIIISKVILCFFFIFTHIVVLLQCYVAKRYDGVRKSQVVAAVTTALMTVATAATAVERDEVAMEVVQRRTKLTFVERS